MANACHSACVKNKGLQGVNILFFHFYLGSGDQGAISPALFETIINGCTTPVSPVPSVFAHLATGAAKAVKPIPLLGGLAESGMAPSRRQTSKQLASPARIGFSMKITLQAAWGRASACGVQDPPVVRSLEMAGL